MNMQLYLEQIVSFFKEELQGNLAGIYLHGSLTMGCFNPRRSDVDFIVVVKERMTAHNKRQIAAMALEISDDMPIEKGLEFSIILEEYLLSFVYPTPCEFHYSDFHKERYRADANYICGGYEDHDLASQLMVAYHRGVLLYGRPLNELYPPVERQFYLASILHDVADAAQEILDKPVYVTLNLCRVLFFLKEGAVSSKKEGGEWGVRMLPAQYRDLLAKCLEAYAGGADKYAFDNECLTDFAAYMLNEINYAQGQK